MSVFLLAAACGAPGAALVDESGEPYVLVDEKADEIPCPAASAILDKMEDALVELPESGWVLATLQMTRATALTIGEEDYTFTDAAKADWLLFSYTHPLGEMKKFERLWHATGFTRSCGGGYFIGELHFASGEKRRVTVFATVKSGIKSLSIVDAYDPFADDK